MGLFNKVLRILLSASFLTILFSTSVQAASPGFSKVFVPDTIGPGSVSTLIFTITNNNATPLLDINFTDNLPADVEIADPPNAFISCHPNVSVVLTANPGESIITLTDLDMPGSSTCTIKVDVTSNTAGIHTNTTSTITSVDEDPAGPASDDLIVDLSRPGFTKTFSPSTVNIGIKSTLTFTIDNSGNGGAATSLSFLDNLPPGIEIADPANVIITNITGGTITAVPGTSIISFSGTSIAAGSTGTISLEVVATSGGILVNSSGELIVNFNVSCGKANAALDVDIPQLSFYKSFTDDPVAPGSNATLEFTITNNSRDDTATNIAFTDNLPAGLVIASPPNASTTCTGGSLTANAGGTVITYSGGSLAPETTCTITVDVTPDTAGSYVNTTGSLTYNIGGDGSITDPVTDTLLVYYIPAFTKTFLTDPAGSGQTVTLEFTITNTDPVEDAVNIAFTDNLDAVMTGLVATDLPKNNICGAGSTLTGTDTITLTGGNLAAGASSTFQVTLDIPDGVAPNTYVNTTSTLTATIDGDNVVGPVAGDTLTVVAAPRLKKSFTDDPAQPGGTVTLEFTLTHDADAPGNAADITFTDDLDAALTGLVATGLPQNDVCGTGSTLTGTDTITLTGGNLAPGASSTFSVTLQIPGGTTPGDHTNTTSNVTATIDGVSATSPAASDDLHIAGLTLTKEFIDDPALPGGTATLRFTIANITPASDFTNIAFTDDLDDTLTGLAAIGLPLNSICGGGSLVGAAGNTLLSFTGGSLNAGETCTFDVTLQVPAGASSGVYNNATDNFRGDLGVSTIFFTNAADAFIVASDILSISKEFTNDPVDLGDTVTLEFTITNLSATLTVTDISFIDDLDAALTGLVATGLPQNSVCGAGSTLSGTDTISLSGGTLGPDASATFSVTLQVPTAATPGNPIINTTSTVTGNVGAAVVTGGTASDNLLVNLLSVSKSFTNPVSPGGTTTLTFILENLDTVNTLANITFTDNLNAVLTGMTATGLPLMNICGSGQISGTSFLVFSGGNLTPGGSCTFDVSVQIPANADAGTYTNTIGNVRSGGLLISAPASGDLVVLASNILSISKEFTNDPVNPGDTVTLEFTITNLSGTETVTDISFIDDLDAALTGLVATGLPQNNVCGAGSTLSGTDTISLSGGSLGPGASATFSVTLQVPAAATPGSPVINTTGTVTGNVGAAVVTGGTASDNLVVSGDVPIPTLSEWGMIILALLLGFYSIYYIRKKNNMIDGILSVLIFFFIFSTASLAFSPNADAAYDYGDAPDPTYPTLLANNGARHIASRDYYLGTSIDPENDGQPNSTATGDDNDSGYDEDGVIFTSPLFPGLLCTIEVTASQPGYLDAWIDFNTDGDWNDQGEQIFTSKQLSPGVNFLSFTVPADAITATMTFSRFRYSQLGDLQPTGEANDGEVEDYAVTIIEEIQDYGDAPAEFYPTNSIDDGARHTILAGYCLGTAIDPDLDGQSNSTATGDDNDFSGDDEEGIEFLEPIIPGAATCQVRVTATITAPGKDSGLLNAWIDFNDDGDWADIGEQIFTNENITHGVNNLTFDIPADATLTSATFARFRFDSQGNLTYKEGAIDGEVEDYLVRIIEEDSLDFGDAPLNDSGADSYNTKLPNGARHSIVPGLYLGTLIDSESDGQPGLTAADDDLSTSDDEDGVIFTSSFIPGATCTLIVTASAPGRLDAWVDKFSDRDWTDPGEHIFTSQALTAGANYLSFSFPQNDQVTGLSYIRFRFSTQGGLSPDGYAPDGEVEDYSITIVESDEDFGDAPDPSYPTLLASNGARHTIVSGFYLGSKIDADPDGQPNATATGDDILDINDDEDGVQFTSALVAGNTASVVVTAAQPGLLDAWVDFNNDGDWADSDEHIFLTQALVAGPNLLTFSVPQGITSSTSFARFRLHNNQQGISYTGSASSGEVEDYQIDILEEENLDFGDAPDYPTLLATNGARHQILSGYCLGSVIDAESDGQPNATATGDDIAGSNDEDGVIFNSPLVQGQNANITVTASLSSFSGTLDAWIDFNNDGDWADSGEKIFNARSLTLGINNLSFPVPQNAAVTTSTFARFRLSQQGGLSYNGWAPEGEVEDYIVEIMEEQYYDFGDADDGDVTRKYPTLLSNNGAGHILGSTYLGASIDSETDGQPDTTATGDDNDGNNDDDGVAFTTSIVPGQDVSVSITASTSGFLNAWIDYNQDFDWSDSNEQIFTDTALSAGVNNLTFQVPANIPFTPTTTIARFRFDTTGGLSHDGIAADGEVEDYEIDILEPEKDFGDADDSAGAPGETYVGYHTFLSNGGARHTIVTGFHLGSLLDAESEGQPSTDASGDDTNGSDDEDGVVFDTDLHKGGNCRVTVTASATGKLDAWIDFNGDGDFNEPQENIFSSIDLTSGANALSFRVPTDASMTEKTFARFRFSTIGGLSPAGDDPDGGEVEDYTVSILKQISLLQSIYLLLLGQ